eukprot:29131-Eustigmatos_ZCMA.PRE.1
MQGPARQSPVRHDMEAKINSQNICHANTTNAQNDEATRTHCLREVPMQQCQSVTEPTVSQ